MKSEPIFSVIHPTLARPKVAIDRCQEWLQKADHPEHVEYVFGLHSFELSKNTGLIQAFAAGSTGKVLVNITPRKGSASNWNDAAAAGTGLLLLQSQDDLAPSAHWDTELLSRLEEHAGADWAKQAVFVAVNDGHRTDRLCITSIMTRVYRDQRGYFLFPGYDGVFADDDSTAQVYDDSDAGRLTLIEARDLVFEHQHYTHVGGMTFDHTYALENSQDHYKRGEALFAERHPRWHIEQLCKTPPPAAAKIP